MIIGQDRFQTMCRNYYQDAHGCFVMFDITNQTSLDNCEKWKAEVDNKVLQRNGDPIPSVLLANKVTLYYASSWDVYVCVIFQSDLGGKTIPQSEIEKFSKRHGFVHWFFISVKTNSNIEESIKY